MKPAPTRLIASRQLYHSPGWPAVRRDRVTFAELAGFASTGVTRRYRWRIRVLRRDQQLLIPTPQ